MISVLIVNHDGRRHLHHCLERLAEAPSSHGEVIVADNASTDGSVEMVREEFPGVRLLELGENLGFGAANNRAAELARGDRLLLLNSDAWLEGDALERLSAALDADPHAGAAAPELRYPDGRRQFAWVPETGVLGEALQKVRNRFEGRGWAHRPPPRWLPVLGRFWLTAACLLVRRQAFEEVGGFDEGYFLYFEDVDLGRRLRLAGWRLLPVPGAVAHHVKGGSQRAGRAELEYRRSQLRYYRRHRPGWENRYLRRRLRRKFARVDDPELRRRLLDLLVEDLVVEDLVVEDVVVDSPSRPGPADS